MVYLKDVPSTSL